VYPPAAVNAADVYYDLWEVKWEPSPEGYFLDYKGLKFIPLIPPMGVTAFTVGPRGHHDDDDDDD
jgi:hypothetical protein